MLNLLSLVVLLAAIPISFTKSLSDLVDKPLKTTVVTSGSDAPISSVIAISSQTSLKGSKSTVKTSTRVPTSSASVTVTSKSISSTTRRIPSSVAPCTTTVDFQNPGFEDGAFAPWTNTCGLGECGIGSGTVANVGTENPHSGLFAMDFSNLSAGDDQYDVEFYLYQEVYACTPGTYTMSFWAVSNVVSDCPETCCAIAVALNDTIVNESPGSSDLEITTSYTQFNIPLGSYTSPTTLKIGVTDVNCYVMNLYLDDFSLTIS